MNFIIGKIKKIFVFSIVICLISLNFVPILNCAKTNNYEKEKATGFFRVEKIDGKWWFITPEGEKFYSICTGVGIPIFYYGSKSDYLNVTIPRLDHLGINTVTTDIDIIDSMPCIARFRWKQDSHLTEEGWTHHRMPDVFDENWQETVNNTAMEYAYPLRNSKNLIGYFTDNEMKWGADTFDDRTLLEVYFEAGNKTAGKRALINFFKERYQEDINSFNEVWNLNVESFDELYDIPNLGIDKAYRITSSLSAEVKSIKKDFPHFNDEPIFNKAKEDLILFSDLVAETYFSVTDNAVRQADPNHLNLGIRIHLFGVPENVLKIHGKYADVISMNNYRIFFEFYEPQNIYISKKYGCVTLDNWMEKYTEITDKPIFVSEFGFRVSDGSWPYRTKIFSPSRVAITRYGQAYSYRSYVTKCFQSPNIIGISWFGYSNYIKSFVDFWNDISPIFEKTLSNVNKKAVEIHENSKVIEENKKPSFNLKSQITTDIFSKIFNFIDRNNKNQIQNSDVLDDYFKKKTLIEFNNKNYDLYVDSKNDVGPWDGSIEHPYKNIQDAIDNATDNSKIFVYNGLYCEKLTIDKPLELCGEDNRQTAISCFNEDFHFVWDRGENTNIIVRSDNVAVKNFNLTTYGVYRDSCDNYRACAGINIKNSDNCIIENNYFEFLAGFRDLGMLTVLNSKNTRIINNFFYENSGMTIQIDTADNAIIKDNIILENKDFGIWVSKSENVEVINNTIHKGQFGIETMYVHNCRFYENKLIDNEQKSIVLVRSTNNEFISNRFIRTEKSIMNNFFTVAMFFKEKGNHWENNYWFKHRTTPKVIFGKIGEESLIPSFEFDRNPQ